MSKDNNKTPEERRKALKKILAGTGAVTVAAAAPEKWTRPVVHSVVLPAHAQTSTDPTPTIPLNFSDSSSINGSNTPTGIIDSLVASAHAGDEDRDYNICNNFNADLETYTASITVPALNIVGLVIGGVVNAEEQFDCSENTFGWMKFGTPTESGVPYEVNLTEGPLNVTFSGTATPGDCNIAVCEDD